MRLLGQLRMPSDSGLVCFNTFVTLATALPAHRSPRVCHSTVGKNHSCLVQGVGTVVMARGRSVGKFPSIADLIEGADRSEEKVAPTRESRRPIQLLGSVFGADLLGKCAADRKPSRPT